MRALGFGGAIVTFAFVLSACGGSGNSADADQAQRAADTYAITQIEEKVHESLSKKDITTLMGLWAPHATFTFGPGKTATGIQQIRRTWLKSPAFKPETNWVSDHPAWKLHVTVTGDRGTLHFECHFIDVKTEKVAATTSADMDVARVNGRWLITRMVGGTAELTQ